MPQILELTIFFLTLLICFVQLHSFFRHVSEDSVDKIFNIAMQQKFSKKNEWRYVVDLPIQVNTTGLRYTLSPNFALHSIRCTKTFAQVKGLGSF